VLDGLHVIDQDNFSVSQQGNQHLNGGVDFFLGGLGLLTNTAHRGRNHFDGLRQITIVLLDLFISKHAIRG